MILDRLIPYIGNNQIFEGNGSIILKTGEKMTREAHDHSKKMRPLAEARGHSRVKNYSPPPLLGPVGEVPVPELSVILSLVAGGPVGEVPVPELSVIDSLPE